MNAQTHEFGRVELQHGGVLRPEATRDSHPGQGRGDRRDQVEGLAGVPRTALSQSIRPDYGTGRSI